MDSFYWLIRHLKLCEYFFNSWDTTENNTDGILDSDWCSSKWSESNPSWYPYDVREGRSKGLQTFIKGILKLVSAIFYQSFIFHQMIAHQKLWKMFLFHWKGSFHFQDIEIFVFSSFPLFFSVNHCFRGWFKKILVCDVINCLIKNFLTHFVWYLEKEIRCDIETLSIDRVLNMEHFYGKIIHKMGTKS